MNLETIVVVHQGISVAPAAIPLLVVLVLVWKARKNACPLSLILVFLGVQFFLSGCSSVLHKTERRADNNDSYVENILSTHLAFWRNNVMESEALGGQSTASNIFEPHTNSASIAMLGVNAIEADCYAIILKNRISGLLSGVAQKNRMSGLSSTSVATEEYAQMISMIVNGDSRAKVRMEEMIFDKRKLVEDLASMREAGAKRTSFEIIFRDVLTDEDRLALTSLISYYTDMFMKSDELRGLFRKPEGRQGQPLK